MTDTTITIGIATRSRPKGLRRLLRHLEEIEAPESNVDVLVVDNDPERSAEAIVGEFQGTTRWPVIYRHVPRMGIPFARNALVEGAASSDFLAFIDDDEVPDAEWLVRLEATISIASTVDAVLGPVNRVLPPNTPPWLEEGGGFQTRSRPALSAVRTGATNNAILRISTLRNHQILFDERFPTLGGSDSYFFRELIDAGGAVIWEPRALVREFVPSNRATIWWVLRRGFRGGYNPTRRRVADLGSRALPLELARIMVRLLDAARLVGWSSVRGRSHLVRAGVRAAAALGTLAAVSRIPFHEYAVVDGE